MPHINSNRRKPAAVSIFLLLLAVVLLAACGGSSKGSSSSTTGASATTRTTPGGGAPRRPGAAGFTALRECLKKNGITLPKPTPGQRGAPGGGRGSRGGPGAQLPKGVTRAQFAAALKKCSGASSFRIGPSSGGLGTQRFARFDACMARNGVKLPPPNTSGKGPIFSTKGLNTSSAKFKSAEKKCTSELTPRGAGATGSGGTGGAGQP
jgi:hypothetical protein